MHRLPARLPAPPVSGTQARATQFRSASVRPNRSIFDQRRASERIERIETIDLEIGGAGGKQVQHGNGSSRPAHRSEEHTSELQSLMRISYAVFCLKKKNINNNYTTTRE